MKRILILLALFTVLPVWAEGGSTAEDAALMLTKAAIQLDEAKTAPNRIAALTATVHAYETGLSAMREGLVAGELRKRELERQLQGRDAELAEFLALLQTVSQHGHVDALVHPGGMRDTINTGVMVSAFVPALQAQADALERQLAELADLRVLQQAGIATLDEGMSGTREARQVLADALESRSDLPPRRPTDEAAMLALLNSSETLQAFADSLLPGDAGLNQATQITWQAPVSGEIWRGFGAKDAAGIARAGITFATPAQSLVVAPAPGNIRFSGEIPDQGMVVVLEPQAGQLVILAGMGRNFAEQGQIVEQGEPIGLMGGEVFGAQEKLNELLRNGSLLGQETLYMEVRQGRGPIDPVSLLTLGDT